ncbi:hypothetical protein NEMIN01_1448, partial [Nematocida minor]|uniref:uncharacterized protein n=1 Tax=Nematocida minor TaxID=1912983 RepID=UPI002220221D
MNRNRRAIIVGGILKIRRPLESKEPEHILRAFAKENALFNKFVLSAPAGIDATVEYLLDNSKNESEWEVTCRAAEALFEKTGNTEIVDRILKRTDTEADKDVISSLFYSIKKLLILNWENKEVVDRIVQHSYTKENEYYFAVALS